MKNMKKAASFPPSQVSLEALAMAGADYTKSGITVEEWKRRDTGPPPPYLWTRKGERSDPPHEMKRSSTSARLRSMGISMLNAISKLLKMFKRAMKRATSFR